MLANFFLGMHKAFDWPLILAGTFTKVLRPCWSLVVLLEKLKVHRLCCETHRLGDIAFGKKAGVVALAPVQSKHHLP